MFETLPSVVHVTASKHGDANWLTTAGHLAVAESTANRSGAAAVVDRLAEALLDPGPTRLRGGDDQGGASSFLAAIQDRSVGRALNLIHQEITRDWNLSELAREAGVSRSVFTERFRALVGESPMVYVARWRMLKARELLLDTSLSVAQVAHAVGYQSEFSLTKAFKRLFGITPGAVRNMA